MIILDLASCYPSLKLPPVMWGTFRMQGAASIYDLRSLPFGWRFSPLFCPKVVAGVVNRLLQPMPLPLPAGYESWTYVRFDHDLDDLLFVESDRDWPSICGKLLPQYLRIEGFVISKKSVLEPVLDTEWLGKRTDVSALWMSNSQMLHTRLFLCAFTVT